MPSNLSLSDRLKNASLVLGMGLIFSLFIYPVFHEVGHLLFAKLFGGIVHGFSLEIINAHAYFSGAFNHTQSAFIDVAGYFVPYIIWISFILLIPKVVKPIIEIIKLFSSVMIIGSTIPWIVIPVLNYYGRGPHGEDISNFIMNSSLNQFVICCASIIILILSILIYRFKAQNLKKLFENKMF